MADFNFRLNRQGPRGPKGEKGDQGFSPVISEGQNTSDTYTLNITNEYETFETPNLRGQFSIEDRGGKYVLYDAENNTLSASDPIPATAEIEGVVSRSTEEDFINVDETAPKFINPNGLFNAMPIVLDSPDDSIIIRQNPDTKRTELIVDGSGTQESLAQERAERIAADDRLDIAINSVNSRVTNVVNDLSTEQQIRLAADTQQQQLIDAERQERETQDASLQNQLSEKLTADNIKAGSNVTITRSGNNVTINSTGGGGGGTAYIAGDGIGISGDVISTRIDNQTIKVQDGVMHADLSEIGDELNSLSGRVNTLEGEVVVATSNRLGLVKPDNSTIIINEEGELTSTVGGTVKFPNATIIGTPTINNGQISNFSMGNYLQFPFEFETQGRTWLLNGSFHTGSNVTTQQNIIDSLAAVALAVRNGRLVMALSTTGTTFDLGEAESMSDIEPNTSYYFRISFSGTQYMLSLSTDKIDYMPEAIVSSSTPIAARPMTISSSGHPYGDIINMNDWDLTVGNVMVWQGMADVGSASRMDVSASNADHSAYEVMKNTTALTSGNITDNTRLYNEVLDRSKSNFDLSKFTVFGNPTITSDGVYTSTTVNNTNYISIPFDAKQSVRLDFTFKANGVYEGYFIHLNDDINSKAYLGSYGLSDYGSTNLGGFGYLKDGEIYDYFLEYKDGIAKQGWKKHSDSNFLISAGITYTELPHSFGIGGRCTDTSGTVTINLLKDLKLITDGEEVFNSNKTGVDTIGDIEIPYILSKTGSKIVEAQYRDRVEDVYNKTGEALYYTLDEDNKQAAAPICDIYGVLTRLNDSIGSIDTMLSIILGDEESILNLVQSINGENITDSLSTTPMMLSLEATELDIENSFTMSKSKAVFSEDLVLPENSIESYEDDTDIDLGGSI